MELTTTFAHYFQLDIGLGHIDMRALLFDEMQVVCRNGNGIKRSGFVMTFKEAKLGQFERKINRFFYYLAASESSHVTNSMHRVGLY